LNGEERNGHKRTVRTPCILAAHSPTNMSQGNAQLKKVISSYSATLTVHSRSRFISLCFLSHSGQQSRDWLPQTLLSTVMSRSSSPRGIPRSQSPRGGSTAAASSSASPTGSMHPSSAPVQMQRVVAQKRMAQQQAQVLSIFYCIRILFVTCQFKTGGRGD
jgi:hypothetical protein